MMVASTTNFITIGRLTSVYGLQGWLKVRSHTEPPENLFAYQPWLLNTDQGFETTLIEKWHRHNKGFIAKIVGVDNRQQAISLCALDIVIEKTHLPPLGVDQYYWHQLEGLRVVSKFNDSEIYLGIVKRLIPTGANDVLVVKGNDNSIDQRERLIPYVVDRYVKRVNLDKSTLYVDWDPQF